MSDSSNLKIPYRIANVIVNPQLHTLQHQNGTVKLEPKAMKLLELLVKNQGQVCSKQQIADEVWPRQIVADDAVTRLIFVLRNALADDAKSPVFISTIPKKGYVFLVEAKPLPSPRKRLAMLITTILLFVALIFIGYNWPTSEVSQNTANYQIERALPITHQEGREYNYVIDKGVAAYFHQHNELTSLLVIRGKSAPISLVADYWRKRSLIIVDNVLFYVRYTSSQYQVVQQTLDGVSKILVESTAPIYSLSMDRSGQNLLFNQYQDNENTRLHQYSFLSGQISPMDLITHLKVNKVYSHYYHAPLDTLFFVGIEGRKPTIYGLKSNDEGASSHITGFERIRYITQGKNADELLVVGTYHFTQGIWSVSLDTKQINLIQSHQDNDITHAAFNAEQNVLYYSFQGQRVDLKEVSLQGKTNRLPHLNSTLIESNASYSSDGEEIYFASDRNGDFELYGYQVGTSVTRQITQLKATKIWYYSFSTDGTKVAVVYSKNHIRLGVVSTATGELVKSVALEEIKFPLSWSADDRYIYISEHRQKIAMYVYDAQSLTIEKKRTGLGLTAVELSPGKVLAFDYQSQQFSSYDFYAERLEAMSDPIQDYVPLAPHNTHSDGKQAMLLYSDGMKKTIFRLLFAKDQGKRQQTLVAHILQSGNMQAFSPEMSALLLADRERSMNGNIVGLHLK
ncbi:winged helix-turn-helix domain-containing protein [Thalassotalea fusca]